MPLQIIPFNLLSGIAATVVGSLIVYIILGPLRMWKARKAWYQEAAALTSQVERLGHRATEYQERTDAEVLQEQLDPLSADLIEHSENAPNDTAKEELKALAKITTGLIIIVELRERYKPTELLSYLQESIKEGVDSEGEELPNLDLINNLISLVDTDGIVEGMRTDIDVNEEQLDDILSNLSEETKSTGNIQFIEDLMEFPFDDVGSVTDDLDIINGVLDVTMREYVRLWLLEVTGVISQRMDTRQKLFWRFR